MDYYFEAADPSRDLGGLCECFIDRRDGLGEVAMVVAVALLQDAMVASLMVVMEGTPVAAITTTPALSQCVNCARSPVTHSSLLQAFRRQLHQ